MKKLALIIPFAFTLVACGSPSVDDLVKNADLLEKTIAECEKLEAKGKNIEKVEKCSNAMEAAVEVASGELMKLLGR